MAMLRYPAIGTAVALWATLAASVMTAQAQVGLVLLVDPYSGVVSIENLSASGPSSFAGYTISSASGALVPDATHTLGVGWDSLTDTGHAGWEELAPSASALTEVNLTSSTSVPALGTISLGHAFAQNATQDAQWSYVASDGTFTGAGAVVFQYGLQVQVIDLISSGTTVESTKAILKNLASTPSSAIDGYVVQSASGSLTPAGFHGFAAHGISGWESVAPSANALTELTLTTSATLAPGAIQILGSPFVTGAAHDLIVTLDVVGQGQVNSTAGYSRQLAGDMNGDRIVDISDIQVVAANYLHQNLQKGDANFDGIVDISDIQVIAAHYLHTLSGGAGGAATVPEPACISLMTLGAATGLCHMWRVRRRS